MNIIVNNLNGSKVDVSEDDNGNTVINITSNEVVAVGSIREAVKESWGKLANPNSHESKMLNRSARASVAVFNSHRSLPDTFTAPRRG